MEHGHGVGPREALIRADAASLLYRHGVGGLLVSASASSLITQLTANSTGMIGVLAWWLVMAAVLLGRAAQAVYWQRVTARNTHRDGSREIMMFAATSLATAAVWAAFPLLFFDELSGPQRAAMAAILSGLAGGATTVLSASLALTVSYIAILLLPVSACFLRHPGPENQTLGVLGIVCFLTLTISARIANNSVLRSLRLTRLNQQLLREKEIEHEMTASANAELRSLQKALEDANQGLEIKVRDRTDKLLTEIRERERYEQELSRLASTDPLTGLCNRSTLTRRLNAALASARPGTRLAVLFIDLDDFKQVNDVRGHHAGDRVLSTVAERLSRTLGTSCDLARWGGDEFVAVLHNAPTPDAAVRLALELRDEVVKPIDAGNETVWVDATIGISLFPDHGDTQDKLVRSADLAMYAAKQNKHHRVRLFDPALAEQVAKGHFLGQCLSDAISNHKLSVVFQPIVDASRGNCDALEALVRWKHPEHGSIPPAEFIPMAERSGDILALGRWVLMEACRAATKWPGSPAVSVNVSAAQVLAGYIIDDVKDALAATGLPADRLHLELTETAFAGDFDGVVPVLATLRGMGIRVSLDDFGTGFSSLSYLQRLPVDTLKIDKAFVAGMENESKSIVKAIISMAEALGYGIVAEGVESRKQMTSLLALGVERQQGYHFARPLPAGAVEGWLRTWRLSEDVTTDVTTGHASAG